MFNISYNALPENAQVANLLEDEGDIESMRADEMYLHENAVLVRRSTLVGKESRQIYRVKHPSLKYVRLPLTFLRKNLVEKCAASDKYIVNAQFRFLTNADIPSICIYFGIYADLEILGEKKCKNHAHCQDFHSYLISEGVEKFIRECNTLETRLTFDTIHSFFNSSQDSRVPINNNILAHKVKNCFWFDCPRDSVQVKVVGNVIVPQGESSWPLVSTIVENNSYDIKMNTVDLGNYPQITSARIFNSRVYITALEGVSLTCDVQLGTLSSVSLDFKPIPQHKLLIFEIMHFKNSNWPMRALTDALITFFAKSFCVPVVVHWSYISVLVRETYLKYLNVYPELSINKNAFMIYVEREQVKEFDLNPLLAMSASQIAEMKASLEANRSFWFLAPQHFCLADFQVKLAALMSHLQSRRTLDFKASEYAFDAQIQVEDVIMVDGFFPTVPMVKGELSLLLMKPNFTTLLNLELFDQLMSPYGKIIKFEVIPKISDSQFSQLYDSCMTRPYGAAWRDYMQSDPVVACVFASENLLVTRAKVIQLRQESKIVWIKNIIHCSSSESEAKRDLRIFFPSATIETLNLEVLDMYSSISALEPKRSAELMDSDDTFDDTGLPSNFPLPLRQNPDIVQFMKYIVDQTKKPNKRQRIV